MRSMNPLVNLPLDSTKQERKCKEGEEKKRYTARKAATLTDDDASCLSHVSPPASTRRCHGFAGGGGARVLPLRDAHTLESRATGGPPPPLSGDCLGCVRLRWLRPREERAQERGCWGMLGLCYYGRGVFLRVWVVGCVCVCWLCWLIHCVKVPLLGRYVGWHDWYSRQINTNDSSI